MSRKPGISPPRSFAAAAVITGLQAFGSLAKLEQYARLKVWIGRFRFYQASQDREVEASEELQSLSHRVFHQLKWLSRQYEPGYIEAFRQDYSTDWASYVAEAQSSWLRPLRPVVARAPASRQSGAIMKLTSTRRIHQALTMAPGTTGLGQ